ncbi:endoribonuclease Dicer [Aphidius gifuensis]|uniref:endoribonuclease Dicer n=1 Tax=Aphidius gifuensis TaxID=684658 RepID=UPI001CDBB72D|nr:endoribonuclease Dicer [Aphidius gifuensis]
MASLFNDQVYTKSFTPREYQVELLYTAKQKNIIICLGKYAEQTFIVTKLIQEYAAGNRTLSQPKRKKIIYILDNNDSCLIKSNYIGQLTDLKAAVVNKKTIIYFTCDLAKDDYNDDDDDDEEEEEDEDDDDDDDEDEDEKYKNYSDVLNAHILVTTSKYFNRLINKNLLDISNINLIIIENCQLLINNKNIKRTINKLESSKKIINNKLNSLRIIGLAVPLFNLTEEPGRLGLEIQRLENAFKCNVETTSDILAILRYSPKPKEYIIEYEAKIIKKNIHIILENCVNDALNFLNDHRYDPLEIYQDDFLEDIQKIPDPSEKPKEMLNDFLNILNEFGPWCADKAALSILILAEKLKIKTPYERHYLLLNMVASVMIKIRAICDNEFQQINEQTRINYYSTSKVHRLLDSLKTYAPMYEKNDNNNKNNNSNEIENLRFKINNKINETDAVQSGGAAATATATAGGNERNFSNNNNNRKNNKFQRFYRGLTDPDLLCGVIFVDKSFTAKILFYLLNEVSKNDPELHFLSPLYTVENTNDDVSYSKDPEAEHKKQEEVLKRFRIHECNLLISTAILEEGIEIPKCNFVVRYNFPKCYRSYVHCKSRAKASDALHVIFVSSDESNECIWQLAQYHYLEKLLLDKCGNFESNDNDEIEADYYSTLIPSYKPLNNDDSPMVTFNSAISLINRYCAKLPSDTFTRLTPEWSIEQVNINNNIMYVCSLRLPINSPLKYIVKSDPMPNKAMSKRLAALKMCIKLHKENELDDNLLPIGKENFKARPEDSEIPALPDEYIVKSEFTEARPGTTKRRQYYYKKTAEALTDCRPTIGVPCYLYHIKMVLTCPLPEEQNTRGRKIYPPEESDIGFGILTLKKIPQLCPFPIYTRSGEVQVELVLSNNTIVLDTMMIECISTFLNYTFTNVLKLQKHLMLFDPNASENSYFIVPVIKINENNDINVDWNFLNKIYDSHNNIPCEISENERSKFVFDSSKYNDAVIMPWYRNQDQPQYFYVAEICKNLSPKSKFPGDGYTTFEEYYYRKYNIKIQNTNQPLLDVDHTSARLNFLTPRYVNRKGVALPTSSEETKRAKRENLEQKQILIAELCAIHPFPASLWRQAVCLPCILYRINALLLANQIRCQVAQSINLGQQYLDTNFKWESLNFGWSLAEVLKKSKEMKKYEIDNNNKHDNNWNKFDDDIIDVKINKQKIVQFNNDPDIFDDNNTLEIGTWSNDMADCIQDDYEDLSKNVTMLNSKFSWTNNESNNQSNNISNNSNSNNLNEYGYYSDESYTDDDDDDGFIQSSDSDDDDDDNDKNKGLKISYTSDNTAEAVEDESKITKNLINKKFMCLFDDCEKSLNQVNFFTKLNDNDADLIEHKNKHYEYSKKCEYELLNCELFKKKNDKIIFKIDKFKNLQKQDKTINNDKININFTNDYTNYIELISNELLKYMSCNNNTLINNRLSKMYEYNGKTCNKVINDNNYIPKLALIDNIDNNNDDDIDDNSLFSFDYQPELEGHPGPSPNLILQALTMSNANDGINLERLETIGDSFLKYAITTYLYCTYPMIHEGKLSHLRSKQVSNLNLYRLGRQKKLGESMIATKFEPHDNWLPPCYYVPRELEQVFIESGVPSNLWSQAQNIISSSSSSSVAAIDSINILDINEFIKETENRLVIMKNELDKNDKSTTFDYNNDYIDNNHCSIPYNLITQHSIPDKSIADCVEALIGAYLIACGPRGALLFMAWLGIHVLPTTEHILIQENEPLDKYPGSSPYEKFINDNSVTAWIQIRYGKLEEPRNPLLRHVNDPENELFEMLDGYDELEKSINYKFRDPSYLLQAFTHASYQPNRLTDCYQRLEFLGDAVLDYLITRHLYEDKRQHSPGALTDLRSALVNNTIFASLAVRCGFHRYFRHLSPGLNVVIENFVRIQEDNGHSISEEYYLIGEDDTEEAEDVEVPKALGDVFESLAGAIFLDSGMSLDSVWKVYYKIMKTEIDQFSTNVPKSPIRELLELEPETAKFGKPEKLTDGRRVRVTVDVFGKGSFKGIGRNYRIAKCTAAKCALKKLKKHQSSYQKNKI